MTETTGTDDREELAGYVDVWWQARQRLPRPARGGARGGVDDADRPARAGTSRPAPRTPRTSRASWPAAPEETAEVGEPPHVTGLMGLYTEIGVVNRREASADAIINEIREAVDQAAHRAARRPAHRRRREARARSSAASPGAWRTLLRNRPLDVWMHEQDVRRAVGRPGNLDTAPARHTAEYLAESLGYVLGKKVGAPAGTSLRAGHGGQRAVRVRGRRERPRPAGRVARRRPR